MAKLIIFLFCIKILSSAIHTTFAVYRLEHLVGLHHATVGEAAVVFIFLATPWQVGSFRHHRSGRTESRHRDSPQYSQPLAHRDLTEIKPGIWPYFRQTKG